MLTDERLNELLEGIFSGDAESMKALAQHLINKEVNAEQQTRAAERAEELMENNVHALNLRGYFHRFGIGGPVNYPSAITLFKKGIARGNVSAMNYLALLYRDGLGEPDNIPNYPAAIALFKKAITRGNARAMNYLALMYRDGLGEPGNIPNIPAAIALFEQAIARGNTDAMCGRASLYFEKLAGPINPAKGIRLFQASAQLNNEDAKENLLQISKTRILTMVHDYYKENFLLPAIVLFQGARQKSSLFSKLPREIIAYILGMLLDEQTVLGTFFDQKGGTSDTARSAYDNIARSAHNTALAKKLTDDNFEELPSASKEQIQKKLDRFRTLRSNNHETRKTIEALELMLDAEHVGHQRCVHVVETRYRRAAARLPDILPLLKQSSAQAEETQTAARLSSP
jgi:TPR repeat protein